MSHTDTICSRLESLRTRMRALGIDALIIPRADEYLGEYIPERNERLLWTSGFSGSAGTVIVLLDGAAIFVDGRYTVQVRQQVPPICSPMRTCRKSAPRSGWVRSPARASASAMIRGCTPAPGPSRPLSSSNRVAPNWWR